MYTAKYNRWGDIMKYPYQVQRHLPDLKPSPWYPCMNHALQHQAVAHMNEFDHARVVDLETNEVLFEK